MVQSRSTSRAAREELGAGGRLFLSPGSPWQGRAERQGRWQGILSLHSSAWQGLESHGQHLRSIFSYSHNLRAVTFSEFIIVSVSLSTHLYVLATSAIIQLYNIQMVGRPGPISSILFVAGLLPNLQGGSLLVNFDSNAAMSG